MNSIAQPFQVAAVINWISEEFLEFGIWRISFGSAVGDTDIDDYLWLILVADTGGLDWQIHR